MPLFTLPKTQFVNSAGVPYASAKLYFYRAGTSTPLTVYESEGLFSSHTQPVQADTNGVFPSIYFDPQSAYDAKVTLTDSNDVEIFTEDNVPTALVGRSNVIPTTLGRQLGSSTYPWLTIKFSSGISYINSSYIQNLSFATLTHDSNITFPNADVLIGGIVVTDKNANYTFAIDDSASVLNHTNESAYTYTVPTNASVAFPLGTTLAVVNTGSVSVTLAPAGGVTLYRAALATGSITVTSGSYVRILKTATNTWIQIT